jgi:hypothetical protein
MILTLCIDLYNTLVSNHFHSVKSLLFSSSRPRNFDGMLGTGLPVSMYTAESTCIKDFNAQAISSLNLNMFSSFIYWAMFKKTLTGIKL